MLILNQETVEHLIAKIKEDTGELVRTSKELGSEHVPG
jgi:hypothetical protein